MFTTRLTVSDQRLVPRGQHSGYLGCPGSLQGEGGQPTDMGQRNSSGLKPILASQITARQLQSSFHPEETIPHGCWSVPMPQALLRLYQAEVLKAKTTCSVLTQHLNLWQPCPRGSPGTAALWAKVGNFHLRWGQQF